MLKGLLAVSLLANALPLWAENRSYVQACENEVGPIPPISCEQLSEIPVTVTKEGIVQVFYNKDRVKPESCDVSYEQINGADIEKFKLNPCATGQRLGVAKWSQGDINAFSNAQQHLISNSITVVNCRQLFHRRQKNRYDEIQVITHNLKTGATCFFNTTPNRKSPTFYQDHGTRGDQLRPLSEPARSQLPKYENKLTRGIGCQSCHNAGPFIRSPITTGMNLLPKLCKGSPYWVVGLSKEDPVQPLLLNNPQLSCQGCHAIGGHTQCSLFLQATGLMKNDLKHLSDHGKSFPFRNWHFHSQTGRSTHLKGLLDDQTSEKYLGVFGEDIIKLSQCCKNPASCQWRHPSQG